MKFFLENFRRFGSQFRRYVPHTVIVIATIAMGYFAYNRIDTPITLPTSLPFDVPPALRWELPTYVPTLTPVAASTARPTNTPPPAPTAPILETVTPTTPARSAQCPASPPQRVDVGMQARVTITDGTPLRVRTEPVVTNNNILIQLPEGTPFEIIGGPSCWESSTNNFTFWQIRMTDGQIGWVAEGTPAGYFIEPLP